jgi:hypothetical protein
MEDAMVINKASTERGFCHGCIYKGQVCTALLWTQILMTVLKVLTSLVRKVHNA